MLKRACDACHVRRVKCGGHNPCEPCQRNGWECSYTLPAVKPGPKAKPVHSKIVSERRKRMEAGSVVEELVSTRSRSPTRSSFAETHAGPSNSSSSPESDFPLVSKIGQAGSTERFVSDSMPYDPTFGDVYACLFPCNGSHTHSARILSRTRHKHAKSLNLFRPLLSDSLVIYFERVFPLHPVVNQASVQQRFDAGHHLYDTSFAALLCSIASMVHLLPEVYIENLSIADDLLEFAVELFETRDVSSRPTLEDIAISMLIGSCAAARSDEQSRAYRMSEMISFAQTLGLDRRQGFIPLDDGEAELATIITWKMATAERSTSLLYSQPLTFVAMMDHAAPLRSPYADNLRPITRLFDAIDPRLMQCINGLCLNGAGLDDGSHQYCCPLDQNSALAAQQAIACILPDEAQLLLPVQLADFTVTKLWMQLKVWLACLSHSLLLPDGPHPELSIALPKTLLGQLQISMDSIDSQAFEHNGRTMSEKITSLANAAEALERAAFGCQAAAESHNHNVLLRARLLAARAASRRWMRSL